MSQFTDARAALARNLQCQGNDPVTPPKIDTLRCEDITMPAESCHLRMLLISDDPGRSERIRELMEHHGMHAELHRVRIGRRAFDKARGRKRKRNAAGYDLVLFDFADADERYLPAVDEIGFTRSKKQPPTVLLTSQDSEQLLSTGRLADAAANLFAPLGLFEFLARAREHGTERFLGAVTIIARIGPLLVRLPGFIADCSKQNGDTPVCRSVEPRVA